MAKNVLASQFAQSFTMASLKQSACYMCSGWSTFVDNKNEMQICDHKYYKFGALLK